MISSIGDLNVVRNSANAKQGMFFLALDADILVPSERGDLLCMIAGASPNQCSPASDEASLYVHRRRTLNPPSPNPVSRLSMPK